MGDFRVRKIKNAEDRRNMYRHAIEDIEVFEQMLEEGIFTEDAPKIGAEQELCIVGEQQEPATLALKLLEAINDEHYTNELALFNLEINLDPLPFSGKSFSEMENELLRLLQRGRDAASNEAAEILMTGILPTLQYRHLQFENMTPIQRYQTLSNSLLDIRGDDFQIYLQGVNDLMLSLKSVLFEACNTSFQTHLQIHPSDFVDKHNWAQMLAGPVLAACTNSPLLFGHELWAETRIALFKQSLDTRSSRKNQRSLLPRVYFGNGWLAHSAADLWKNDLSRFPLLLTSDDLKNSKECLKNGEIPELRAIRLHNGTTYTWNRMCYGPFPPKPHLRIECRYMPSGPSAADEMANFAFWAGLMSTEPPKGAKFWKNIDFLSVKDNFIRAARTGLGSVLHWFGKNINAQQLILDELLPLSEAGLRHNGVDSADIQRYLGIIEKRVESEQTGSQWTIQNFRALSKRFGDSVAAREIVALSLHYQKNNIPIHAWKNPNSTLIHKPSASARVEQEMSRDVISCHEQDSLDLVRSLMKWHNIHHLPIENADGDLVGLITDGMLSRLDKTDQNEVFFAEEVMMRDFITVEATHPIDVAIDLMREQQISGLPVVYGRKLVGIITERDLATV